MSNRNTFLLITLCLLAANISSQPAGVNFNVGNLSYVANPCNVPNFAYIPDGAVPSAKSPDGSQWMMIWPQVTNYISYGSSPYPEDQQNLNPSYSVFGGVLSSSIWYQGGSWMLSFFQLNGSNYVSFFHAEYHYWPQINPNGIAWKSIGVIYTSDAGQSWSSPVQIITSSQPIPSTPTWGGSGDLSVMYDNYNKRWVMFYQDMSYITAAISSDPEGQPGTWYKWNGNSFSSPGIGGAMQPFSAFTNQEGANPMVHWNTYLNVFIMFYGGWDGNIYLSSSNDYMHWSSPQVVVQPQQLRAWYPSFIGDDGEMIIGQSGWLYYAEFANTGMRELAKRYITFNSLQENKDGEGFLSFDVEN